MYSSISRIEGNSIPIWMGYMYLKNVYIIVGAVFLTGRLDWFSTFENAESSILDSE